MASAKAFLGDAEVVRAILARVVATALEAPDRLREEIEQVTAALAGENPAFEPIAGWTGERIGAWIRASMRSVPDGGPREAVAYAVAQLGLHALEAPRLVADGHLTEQQAGERLASLLSSWTAMMLGEPAGEMRPV